MLTNVIHDRGKAPFRLYFGEVRVALYEDVPVDMHVTESRWSIQATHQSALTRDTKIVRAV